MEVCQGQSSKKKKRARTVPWGHSRLYMQPRGECSVEDNSLDPTRQVVLNLVENGGNTYHMDGAHCQRLLWWFTSLVPRPLPDFISQPWRKIGIKSGSGLGTRLVVYRVQVYLFSHI